MSTLQEAIIQLQNRNKQLQEKNNQLSQELKKTESWLDVSEKRMRTLVKVIPAGLLITDREGKIEGLNSEAERIFGRTDAGLVGQLFSSMLYSAEKSKEAIEIEKLLEFSEAHEFMAKCPNGESVPVQVQIREFACLPDEQLLVVLEDVTKRFEIEKMKADFLAMVSHDLRTPLTSISTFQEMVVSGVYDDNLEMLKKRIRMSQLELKRLINMINGLLDLEKMETGHFEILVAAVDCRRLLELSLNSIEALAEAKQIEIAATFPDSTCWAFADEKYILQVLVNLLSNALKFSPPESKIIVCAERIEGQQVKFLVTDEGPGISAEFKSRMFNKFEQAQVSDSRVKGGTGLGLAFSKQIIELHGGGIGVDSEEGLGSTFWFTLPMVVSRLEQSAETSGRNLPSTLSLKRVYLETIIESAAEKVGVLADELGIELNANGTDAMVLADNDLLLKALISLLTLAVRTAFNISAVMLDVEKSESNVVLSISQSHSSGCFADIPLDDEIFDDEARSSFAFCKRVMEMHNGSILIQKNSEQQLSIFLELPLLRL